LTDECEQRGRWLRWVRRVSARPTAPIIELQHVSRIYDTGKVQVPALVDADLKVADGEFLAIIGPSGSGKSTMMNILGCLDRPTSGRHILDGQLVDQLDDNGLAQVRSRSIGFAALERLGLGDRLSHEPSELSGGQQQRVGIARAIVTEPALILADEPTGNLDSHSGAEVLALFRDLHALGRTIVLITHDVEVAEAADRAVHIRDGRLHEQAALVDTRT